jgi:WhiB family transcriptional regulator, redox-sensing transcriptional regulator
MAVSTARPDSPGITGAGAALSSPMSRNPEIVESTDFFAEAACQGADTAVFFPVSDTFAGEAKAICATCPVAEACLEYAIATRQGDGVWGGLTAVERHRLLRRRQKVAREQARETSAA